MDYFSHDAAVELRRHIGNNDRCAQQRQCHAYSKKYQRDIERRDKRKHQPDGIDEEAVGYREACECEPLPTFGTFVRSFFYPREQSCDDEWNDEHELQCEEWILREKFRFYRCDETEECDADAEQCRIDEITRV